MKTRLVSRQELSYGVEARAVGFEVAMALLALGMLVLLSALS